MFHAKQMVAPEADPCSVGAKTRPQEENQQQQEWQEQSVPAMAECNAVRHSSPSITDRRWNSVHNFLKLAEEPPGSLRGRRTLPCSNQAESGQTPPLRPRRKARLKEHLGRQSLETRVKNISEPLQQLSQLGPLLSRNRRQGLQQPAAQLDDCR
ncbi:unnamed protein product [Boreogadus saida]